MAVNMFLKIDDIKGESVDKTHKDWIDVMSWSWGMSHSGTTHADPGGGAGKVSVNDLSFTHFVDSASPNMIKMCCNGKQFKQADLVVRKAGGSQLEYLKIKFTDILVSSVRPEGSGGEDRISETVTLNFAEFEVQYTGQKAGAAIPVAWNIPGNNEGLS
jgi:type VI secretion system secreted protein Hcp